MDWPETLAKPGTVGHAPTLTLPATVLVLAVVSCAVTVGRADGPSGIGPAAAHADGPHPRASLHPAGLRLPSLPAALPQDASRSDSSGRLPLIEANELTDRHT